MSPEALLSLEALRRRGIPILGIALLGGPHPSNEQTLLRLGEAPVLGRLPLLDPLTPQTLRTAFAQAFADGLQRLLRGASP